jgi:excisionase family DNA binding protein
MNARQVALQLGVSERTVRRWIASGRLHAVKEGRDFRISLGDAELALKEARGVPIRQVRDSLIELQGRYKELHERIARLEEQLAAERRRSGKLEAQLERRAA